MSFVSVVAMDNFISVVADGRATNSETNEIITEDYLKIRPFNEKQFVSCTGNASVAEFVFSKFKPGQYYNLEECSKEIYNLINSDPCNKERVLVVIGGINLNGEIEFYNFSNDKDNPFKTAIPKGNQLEYAFLFSNELPRDNMWLDEEFIKLYEEFKPQKGEDIINLQIKLNNSVADIDSSVNKITKYLFISV